MKSVVHKVLLPLLFSFCFVCCGFLNVNVYAAGDIFTDYVTFVENEDTSSAGWISGTTSTNGNVNITIDIQVTAETVTFIGSGSIGYNAGLFIPLIELTSGDVIEFNYTNNLSDVSTDANGWLRYGIKYTPDGTDLKTYDANDYGTDVTEFYKINTQAYNVAVPVEFTAVSDGYLYLFCCTNSDLPANYTISDISINGDEVKNEIVQAIEDQYTMEDGEDFGIDEVISEHNEKMGVLSFGSDVMIQLLDMFQNTEPGAAQLTLPGFTITVDNVDYQVWDDQTFNFDELEAWVPDLIDIIRTILPVFVWLMVLKYCISVFERYFLSR